MAGGTIKITKWMILRRKILDGLNSIVARVRTWAKNVTGSRRTLKSSDILTLRDRIQGRADRHNDDAVIHIKRRAGTEPANETATRRSGVPPYPSRRVERNGQGARPAGRGIINVEEMTKQVCPACTGEIIPDEPQASCQRNKEHVIHMGCIGLVKNKCPICKGRVG